MVKFGCKACFQKFRTEGKFDKFINMVTKFNKKGENRPNVF